MNDTNNMNNQSINETDEKKLKMVAKGCWGFLILFVVLSFVFFGHYSLTDEQYAVVTTFGSPTVVDTPGLKFKIPYIQKVHRVPKSIIGMAIGYDPETDLSIDKESMMITSDFNFVNVDFYMEYRVSDPLKAVINANSAEDIIKNLAQSYIRDTVGVHTVDDVMTTGKAQIQSEIESQLKERIAKEDIGYQIERVMLQDSELPDDEVQAAFNNVESEKQSMDTKINNAKRDRSTRIPAVEAEADNILKNAEAYKEQRVNEANGQVARFEEMYKEYQKYPLITKKRMFYETMESVLPGLKVIINGSDGTQTMLPLDSFSNTVINQSENTTN